VKRAILAAAVLLLAAGCGVTAGGSAPGGTIPAGQTVRAPAQPAGVPAQPAGSELHAAPALAPAPTPAPVRVVPPAEPAAPIAPPEGDGVPGHGCPSDPHFHKLCPV
jgi:hypothetical protein